MAGDVPLRACSTIVHSSSSGGFAAAAKTALRVTFKDLSGPPVSSLLWRLHRCPINSERVVRPSSNNNRPGIAPPRGLNKNHLTLVLSCLALVTAVAGAGVSYYRLYAAEQLKTLNEAGQLQLDARVNSVLEECNKNPDSHPRLSSEFHKLHDDLNYHPPAGALSAYEDLAFAEFARRFATSTLERRKMAAEVKVAVAAEQNQVQDTVKKRVETGESVERTRKAAVDASVAEELVRPAIPIMRPGVLGAAGKGEELLGAPRGSTLGSPPFPMAVRPSPDPLKNTSTIR